jgi:hypothetical protein
MAQTLPKINENREDFTVPHTPSTIGEDIEDSIESLRAQLGT